MCSVIIAFLKELVEDCDKEENLEVTGSVATSCLKRR